MDDPNQGWYRSLCLLPFLLYRHILYGFSLARPNCTFFGALLSKLKATWTQKINSAMKKVTRKQKLSGLFPKSIVSTSSQTCMNAFSKAKDKSILACDQRKKENFPLKTKQNTKTWTLSILEFWSWSKTLGRADPSYKWEGRVWAPTPPVSYLPLPLADLWCLLLCSPWEESTGPSFQRHEIQIFLCYLS